MKQQDAVTAIAARNIPDSKRKQKMIKRKKPEGFFR